MVSSADLYAGKAVAALDRQHPRDFFDWRDPLASEGIDDELRRAFLIYTISRGPPMFEVLAPPRKDLTDRYEREFNGMTEKTVPIEELAAAREELTERARWDQGPRTNSNLRFVRAMFVVRPRSTSEFHRLD